MENPGNISLIVAFLAGAATFFSPCILPLIPAYVSYLTGISFGEISGTAAKERRRKIRLMTAVHSLCFIFGFSFVFVLLGMGVTFLGRLLIEYQPLVKRIGGALIIFLGLVIMNVIKLPFLQKEKKISYRKKSVSVLGSVLVGAVFAAAWTPCVGPILGSILVYGSSTASLRTGVKLLGVFSLGLGLPFFLASLAINSFLAYVKKIEKYTRFLTIFTGAILIIFGGILLIGGRI